METVNKSPTMNNLIVEHKVTACCGHAFASNYCMIFVPLDYMYCEAGSPSDDNCSIESIWITDNTYQLSIIGIRNYMLKWPLQVGCFM